MSRPRRLDRTLTRKMIRAPSRATLMQRRARHPWRRFRATRLIFPRSTDVLSAKASLPDLTAPVSLGVSGGKLLHRVSPAYPIEARALRQGGTVVLAATVMEDGRVGSVRVIDGPQLFAQSAVEAVKQWRYKPFELDGKPVKNEIGITLHFKYPAGLGFAVTLFGDRAIASFSSSILRRISDP